jgi:hypothetical protein
MDLEKTVEYLKGMAILGDHVSVWPSPAETLLSSQKLETNRMLCSCATSLGFRHPMVAPLEDGDVDAVFDSIMRGDRDAVLKRDQSGWSKHIITKYTPNAETTLDRFRREAKLYWDVPDNPFPRPVWFIQPYLPHLIRLGEVRCFFVNGAHYYAVATTPHKFDPLITANTPAQYKRPLSTFG